MKAAALFSVVQARGPEMNQSETVTLFNDMCFLAPATLIDRAIAWEPVDARTVRATFRNAGHTIRAQVFFGNDGSLIDFASDDRYQLSPDGRTATQLRWTTPLGSYRPFGAFRLAGSGEARWHEPGREYAYIELAIDDVEYNLTRRD